MNKFLKILSALILLFILGAPSCENEEDTNRREYKRLEREIRQIYSDLESIDFTDSVLLIYQTSAQEKLMDMVDYYQILSDTSMDSSIRIKAAELLLHQFKSRDDQEQSIDLLLQNLKNNDHPLTSSTFDSIQLKQALQKKNEYYQGRFSFQQKWEESPYEYNIAYRNIDFYLLKEEKIFGTDTLNIWDIRFGDIQ